MLTLKYILPVAVIFFIGINIIACALILHTNSNATQNDINDEPNYKEYAKVARYLVHKSGMYGLAKH